MKKKLLTFVVAITTLIMAACKPVSTTTTSTGTTTTTVPDITEPTTTIETTTTTETTTEVVPSTLDDCEALIATIASSLFGKAVAGEDYVVDEVGGMVYTAAGLVDSMTIEEAYSLGASIIPSYMTVVEDTLGEGQFQDGTLYYGAAFLNEKQDMVLELSSYLDETTNVLQYLAYLL